MLLQSRQPIPALANYCQPSAAYNFNSVYQPEVNFARVLQNDTLLTNRYSHRDLVMANALGILPLLRKSIQLRNSHQPQAPLERVANQQQILNQLLGASTQIASVAADLDCEAEQVSRLADYLDQRNSNRVKRLTIFSVVTGGIVTIALGFVQSSTATKLISVVGGGLSAGSGGLAAFSSKQMVRLSHQPNLLTDVWRQADQSDVYPTFIWRVLTNKLFSSNGQSSISYNVRQRWQHYVLNGMTPAQEAVYFGSGGLYAADDLHKRASMLNQMQASVRAINQDLQSLVFSTAK